VEWIHLVQDRDRWRAVVSAMIDLPNSGTTELLSYLNIIKQLIRLCNFLPY
jgi:hypothetical protein